MDARNRTKNQRDLANTGQLALWTVAWVASLALAQFGPELLWGSAVVVSWAAIVLNLALGVVWMIAHARFLRGLDDLQRKIQMDAMAVALGVGLVGGFAYAAAESAGLVSFDAGIAVLSVVLAVVYIAAIAAGSLRYR